MEKTSFHLQDNMKHATKITAIEPQQGQKLSIAGGAYRIVISGEETDGDFAVIEMTVPPGGGPTPHSHAQIQESFYVLEGEVEFRNEGGTFLAKKGGFVSIPLNGPVHCFKNKSDVVAKLLCTVIPAGLEAFFVQVSGAIAENPVPDPQIIKAIAEKFGQTLYPPDYLDELG
jgi:quercetin dioxygenase-like cupin family protein